MLLERFNVEKDETRGGTTPPAQSERKTALFPGGSAFPLLTKKCFTTNGEPDGPARRLLFHFGT
ncbi:hypothetical protein [uncultured Desulfovibrio sp.]|uniref:hypothetical protein n=1 Tax=uncultured Desulfovibrio sp. TaxID=167968 RepID=UPI002609EB12|nr:hypothetical protein [uncultured Desulfovibrio sp.]